MHHSLIFSCSPPSYAGNGNPSHGPSSEPSVEGLRHRVWRPGRLLPHVSDLGPDREAGGGVAAIHYHDYGGNHDGPRGPAAKHCGHGCIQTEPGDRRVLRIT